MIIRCFNVGQGNCILVELPPDASHEAARFGLIDCFTSSDLGEPRVLSYLRERKVSELEFVALTHPDADHCTGLSQVLDYYSAGGRRFKTWIESIYDCQHVSRVNEVRKTALGGNVATPHGVELKRIADLTVNRVAKKKADFKCISMGHAFVRRPLTDDLAVQFFAPTNEAFLRQKAAALNSMEKLAAREAPPPLNLNDGCLAFQLLYGDARILFCGDVTDRVWTEIIPQLVEEQKLDKTIDLESDFVAVTHHGAETGNPRALWDVIAHKSPDEKGKTVAVISCGYSNKYKHPSEKTLNLALSRNVMLFCINLGKPCHALDVMSHRAASILDLAISEINKTPLERALSGFAKPALGLCSGDCDFNIEKTGVVSVLHREQESHCAYSALKEFSNRYSAVA
jgi:beta-lactamase superfamily II metal-dependent hydrolase